MYQVFYIFLSLIISLFESPQVILITLDGVRWQEIYYGTDSHLSFHLSPKEIIPNIYSSFVEEGIALGKVVPVEASGPYYISLPGYLEIVRGHQSYDCTSNKCSPYFDQSIFYHFQYSAVFGSWYGIRKAVPFNTLTYVNVDSKYRLDEITELESSIYLRDHNPEFLWIALGDTDESAHRNSYSNYITALQNADLFIGNIVKKYPYSLIIVTTDHGRSDNFTDHYKDYSSARVWIMMRGRNIIPYGYVNVSASLSDIYPTILDHEFEIYSPHSILRKINNGQFR